MLSKFNAEISNKQVQKAGDGSRQFQMINPTLNVGITEKRAREIFTEMNEFARQSYTKEAHEIALDRVGRFEELLMNKVQQVDGMLENFRDPSFQILLVEAQKRAAASERDVDFEMLTELLVHRVEKKDDRKVKASISRAVEIVDQIDDDALCGLTLAYAINNWGPGAGNISKGLTAMNDLFLSLCYRELPTGFAWIEHLDILDAVRTNSSMKFISFKDYYSTMFNGYMCVGIQINSENYSKAIEILREADLSENLLVVHELNDGFMRLNVPNKESISHMEFFSDYNPQVGIKRKIVQQEIDALNKVWELYSTDAKILENVKNAFMEKWNQYETLNLIRVWWGNLPYSFTITPIGKALAHANAKRYNNDVPNINL